MLEKCVLTVLELIWNQCLGHKQTKLQICEGFSFPLSSWLLKLPIYSSYYSPNFPLLDVTLNIKSSHIFVLCIFFFFFGRSSHGNVWWLLAHDMGADVFGYCDVNKIGGERKGMYFDFHAYILKTLSWKYLSEAALKNGTIEFVLLHDYTGMRNLPSPSWRLGSFSNDDGDGKKNVT